MKIWYCHSNREISLSLCGKFVFWEGALKLNPKRRLLIRFDPSLPPGSSESGSNPRSVILSCT